jgi:hypothetical protein
MEKDKSSRRLYIDQTKSGAKPLRDFATLSLLLGIAFAALIFLLAFYETIEYVQALALGLPLLLASLFLYFFCKGFATIVESAAIQRAIAVEMAQKEGLVVYDTVK